MLKPIETIYNGYRFRSRLEARWAVFFDTLGIKYEYEKEGYDLDGTWYLPDFWLPEHNCWIEIKGRTPTREESDKTVLLSLSTNYPAYIFYGGIWLPGVDDIEQVERYGGEVIEDVPKSAEGYIPSIATLLGTDTTSPCYKQKCPHDTYYTGLDEGCPYGQFVPNSGEEGKLVRAMYLAEMKYSNGDRCQLRFSSDNKLHFLRPSFSSDFSGRDQFSGYEELPLPQMIEDCYEDFVTLLQRFSLNWEWCVGSLADVLIVGSTGFRWCECSFCGELGITPMGDEKYLPCHKKHKRVYGRSYSALPDMDRTERLITAYAAARQARFEHGG